MSALAAIMPAVSSASLDYQAFKTAMVNACKVIDRHASIPVLATVLIKEHPGGQGVTVTGTDQDIFTSTFVPGRVTPGFAAIVDAHRLKFTMEKVKDTATIDFSQADNDLAASIGKLKLSFSSHFEEAAFPASQAFRTALGTAPCSFVLPSAVLAKALKKVEFAISTEETRYYLCGAYMHVDEYEKKLTFVATDGHRMAIYRVDVPAGAAAMPKGVIIPQKTITELLRLVSRKNAPAETMITVCTTGVSFLIGEDELLESKVVDGTYPDYGRTVPRDRPLKSGVSTSSLIEAVRQVTAIKNGANKLLEMDFSPARLALRCHDVDFGAASLEINVTGRAKVRLGLNYGYLRDILSLLEGGAMFEMCDESSPLVIMDGADPNVTFVQMPMRL